ncbi:MULTISPECIES: hypothetical protein [Xanthobacter]|uniref:hypothetical protein n=1 Tax=Xanthobacter TaxID=279 RepID=UPI00372C1FD3
MLQHSSATDQHQFLLQHRRLIHAPSEAIIRAWCNPDIFSKFHASAPHLGVTFSIDPAATHRASITLGSPHDDIQERLPLCISYEPAGSARAHHIAGPVNDPHALKLCLTLSPTFHLAAGFNIASPAPRTSCTLSLGTPDGDAYEGWTWSLLYDVLPLLADAL